jgi:hypothetical protein
MARSAADDALSHPGRETIGRVPLSGAWNLIVFACRHRGQPYVELQLVQVVLPPGPDGDLVMGNQKVTIPARAVDEVMRLLPDATRRALALWPFRVPDQG